MNGDRIRGDGPGGPLGTALAMIESLLGTPRLSLWDVRTGTIHLRYAHPKLCSRANEVWTAHRSELLGGHTVQVDGAVYYPLVRGRLVGVLEAAHVCDTALDTFSENALIFLLHTLPDALAPAQPGASLVPDVTVSRVAGRRPAGVVSGALERVPRDVEDELERRKLRKLLKIHAGNMAAVARALDIDRVTVWRRMKRLGVEREEPSPKRPRAAPHVALQAALAKPSFGT